MYIKIKIKKNNHVICVYKNISRVALLTQTKRHHELWTATWNMWQTLLPLKKCNIWTEAPELMFDFKLTEML